MTVIPFLPPGPHALRSSLPTDKPVTIDTEFHLLHPRHAEVVPICKWELNSRRRINGRATIRAPNQTRYAKSALSERRPPHYEGRRSFTVPLPGKRVQCN